jgi:hypothetical protein
MLAFAGVYADELWVASFVVLRLSVKCSKSRPATTSTYVACEAM